MRAVWSFWSKPFQGYMGRTWREPLHHCLAWGLSLRLARRHYRETVLVTDDAGAAFLVDQLGLSFTHVSTELNRIRKTDIGWWTMGKLLTYSLQDQPFIHLDTDVFLWKPLPRRLTDAPVFAQSPEEHHPAEEWCGARDVENAFAQHSLPLPVEWQWVRSCDHNDGRQANCGILGGTRTDFIRYYANQVMNLLTSPANAPAWDAMSDKSGFNPVIEQFTLSAFVRYHRAHRGSPYEGVHLSYLFPSFMDAYNAGISARLGFTHLLGPAKQDPHIAGRLVQRVQREDPRYYRHCVWLNRDRELFAAAGD
ncbi:MAG: DUF6734 family protein [Silvibacterium sp.]